MTKTTQPFSIARYEAQARRTKQRLASKLLRIAYQRSKFDIVGDTCYIGDNDLEMLRIENYLSVLCDHVPASAWGQLNRGDRYPALHLLVPKEYHTPVPGGMVYQVRFANGKFGSQRVTKDEWVFLTVGHEIGLCKLVPQTLAARVF